jgi:hypothetical protein
VCYISRDLSVKNDVEPHADMLTHVTKRLATTGSMCVSRTPEVRLPNASHFLSLVALQSTAKEVISPRA